MTHYPYKEKKQFKDLDASKNLGCITHRLELTKDADPQKSTNEGDHKAPRLRNPVIKTRPVLLDLLFLARSTGLLVCGFFHWYLAWPR